MMPSSITETVVALLSPEETEQFLPAPLLQELRDVAPRVMFLDPGGASTEALEAALDRAAPQVVIAAWSASHRRPRLPTSVRYLCYLCGSVKPWLSREQLTAGLVVTNWGQTISRTVAEAALLHVLNCLRRTTHWTFALHHERAWQPAAPAPAESLFGRRVGLHGFGAIARELVQLIQPFRCTVSAFAPDLTAEVQAKFSVQRAPSLEWLFAENDVIVELAPLIPATVGSVDERLLRLIRPGGVFVNVGRGAVVDEAGLSRVAQEGQLQIGLDVYAHEPLPPDSPLRGLRNVSLTPHVAGPTIDRRRDAGALALRNVRAFAAQQPLEAQVTPEVYDRIT